MVLEKEQLKNNTEEINYKVPQIEKKKNTKNKNKKIKKNRKNICLTS